MTLKGSKQQFPSKNTSKSRIRKDTLLDSDKPGNKVDEDMALRECTEAKDVKTYRAASVNTNSNCLTKSQKARYAKKKKRANALETLKGGQQTKKILVSEKL